MRAGMCVCKHVCGERWLSAIGDLSDVAVCEVLLPHELHFTLPRIAARLSLTVECSMGYSMTWSIDCSMKLVFHGIFEIERSIERYRTFDSTFDSTFESGYSIMGV